MINDAPSHWNNQTRIRNKKCTPKDHQHTYLPDMIIIGTQKGGTSFLNRALRQHPDIAAFAKDFHILDQFEYSPFLQKRSSGIKSPAEERPATSTVVVDACQIQQDYRDLFVNHLHCSKNFSVLLEKTPAYIFRSNVIPDRLACVFPGPIKILAILRDPSKRAYSNYQKMLRAKEDNRTTPDIDTFMSVVEPERAKIQQLGILPGLEYDDAVTAWQSFFDTKNASGSILRRGLYAFQLSQWIETLSTRWGITKEELVKEYMLILDNDDLMADTQGVLNRVLEFAGPLSPYQFDLLEAASATKGASVVHNYTSLTEKEQSYLDDFFQPYNADLHHLLAPYGVELGFAKRAAEAMGYRNDPGPQS